MIVTTKEQHQEVCGRPKPILRQKSAGSYAFMLDSTGEEIAYHVPEGIPLRYGYETSEPVNYPQGQNEA